MLEIRKKISFFILRSIGSDVTSSRCADDAFLYPTHICQYSVMAMKEFYQNPYNQIKLDMHSLSIWEGVWHFTEYIILYQPCNTFQFTSKSQNITPVTSSVGLLHVLRCIQITTFVILRNRFYVFKNELWFTWISWKRYIVILPHGTQNVCFRLIYSPTLCKNVACKW